MHFIKVIGNITNCVMLLIFHDIRLFKPYALNVSLFCIELNNCAMNVTSYSSSALYVRLLLPLKNRGR